MSTAKKKVKILIVIAVAVIFAVLIYNFAYDHYFRQDITQFRYGFSAGSAISPDEQHEVSLVINRAERDSDISYIVGWLNFADDDHPYNRWATSEPRIIFWQRVETDSIGEKVLEESDWHRLVESGLSYGLDKNEVIGQVLYNWVNTAWIDNNTIYINGFNVNINRGFDYRRN